MEIYTETDDGLSQCHGSATPRWLSGIADGILLTIAGMYAPFRAGDFALLFYLLPKLN